MTEYAARTLQRSALRFRRAPRAPQRRPGEPEEHRDRREGRDDDDVTADHGAAAEQRLLEAVLVHANAHPRQLAAQLLEDRVRPRVGEQVAKEIVAAGGEVAPV